MSNVTARRGTRGPLRAEDLRSGDPYELSDGHPVFCAPSGGDGARGSGLGFAVLDSDPAVEAAGVEPGYSPEPQMLRAPDVGVGNVPDRSGWISGVPPLAVEYASVGQDEAELQAKIADLLGRGTRSVWVVRLLGPRRVEVYEPGCAMRIVSPGERLAAPGLLRNEVPVEALYDRDAAHEISLRNLLQRRGYEGLEAVRAEGRAEGREQGRTEVLRQTLRDLCEALGLGWTQELERRVAGLDAAALDELRETLKRDRRLPE
ncbi:MAG: hypothetical protein HY744_10205 [Deltaproteobacteria bacterium]|nr:hypothetical protein [Deltaproteobacteria bacterium]